MIYVTIRKALSSTTIRGTTGDATLCIHFLRVLAVPFALVSGMEPHHLQMTSFEVQALAVNIYEHFHRHRACALEEFCEIVDKV